MLRVVSGPGVVVLLFFFEVLKQGRLSKLQLAVQPGLGLEDDREGWNCLPTQRD